MRPHLSPAKRKNVVETIFSIAQGVLERDKIGVTDFRTPNKVRSPYARDAFGGPDYRIPELDWARRTFEHEDYKYEADVCFLYSSKLGCEVAAFSVKKAIGEHPWEYPLFFQAKFPVSNFGKVKQQMLILAKKLQHRPVYDIMQA